MTNPYTRENPGNFANDPERARKAGKTTAERYLPEARKKNKNPKNQQQE